MYGKLWIQKTRQSGKKINNVRERGAVSRSACVKNKCFTEYMIIRGKTWYYDRCTGGGNDTRQACAQQSCVAEANLLERRVNKAGQQQKVRMKSAKKPTKGGVLPACEVAVHHTSHHGTTNAQTILCIMSDVMEPPTCM